MDIRVGFGFDVHQLVDGEEFILGGIKIDYHKGLKGHSDADVLLHAITDALLGAANLRDIGYHFPDTDPKYKGADSKVLLKDAYAVLKEKGYSLMNMDCTVALQKPKIKDLIEPMKECIAEVLQVDIDRVSLKATTTEKLGYVGNETGVNAYATVLISR
jgi:2-C-methyl-D-erythritol 2,4-cyclodiphosphate synthase